MANIQRRKVQVKDSSGRIRTVTRYRVRYRDWAGVEHGETFKRSGEAERRKAQVETELDGGTWRDPKRGEIRLDQWAKDWIETRHDLRATTRARLDTTMRMQVLPKFGKLPLIKISNAAVRAWVAEMLASGLSAASARKAVFALRHCLEAAVADGRLMTNPAAKVPLPSERAKAPRYLSQTEVETLVDAMQARYRALVLVGAFGGLRWGEAAGLTRAGVDVRRSRIIVTSTAVEIGGKITLGNEPKTRRSKRSVPVARAVMGEIEEHLRRHVGPESDALVFTGPRGGPMFRATFSQQAWRPAAKKAGLSGVTFHSLRHSFVAILVAAGCNVREVSEWAGHSSVAFTLTRYGGLFEDGSDAAVDRLDNLLGGGDDMGP
ncbi:putative integrase [Microlunatus phosphovorus NM-1]|uniref:Putative integrase n=1 Tax=Microlunatus phosphovorus (strain ATCC 700054 / DSM 10555 / JCM 9379 / NBRC 101784 / NCIMB 13414 / VKM Ac-1990 / NM-1) TaxID=1032480 RepID=F5XSI9_MICPN|nr:site-specific integrase [Microlunatus phosphovorus]BAK34870.1 putative integrase [Microlunatus phosphovorus NM-1]